MASSVQRFGCVCVAAGIAAGLAGCDLRGTSTGSEASSGIAAVAGMVHGAQQPVAGASIQLYEALAGGNKGVSTALLTSPVLTRADGSFSIPASASCSSSTSLVYVVATGGNPGLPGMVENANLALMALVGTCGQLATDSFVSVNELTTVASVEVLAPFMADYAHVGSDPGNPNGLSGAYASAAAMVNFATGQLAAPAPGVTLPTALLNTLADILAACVNTAGGMSGDMTSCGTLLADAGSGTATETIGAMQGIVAFPGLNTGALFKLASTDGPFQMGLAEAPGDFSLSLGFGIPLPTGAVSYSYGSSLLAIDSAQHVWVYTNASAYDAATGSNDIFAGTITIFDSNGDVLKTIQPGAGGLDYPGQLAADPFGNMWAVNQNLTLSKFDANGNPLSPSAGYPVPYLPPAYLGGSTANYPLGISYMESDPSGNLWGIGSGTTSNCFIEVNASGSVITPSGNFCTSAGNSVTIAAATDGSGNAWFVGTNSVSKVSSTGAFVASGVNTNGCFDFDLTSMDSTLNSTISLAYDRLNNQLWGAAEQGIGAIRADGSQVFCDYDGANLPLIPYYTSVSGSSYSGGFQFVDSIAVDGGGNLWFTYFGEQVMETLGAEPTITVTSGLAELDQTGKLVTPKNAAGVTTIHPAPTGSFQGLAVDGYGDLWIAGANHVLYKVPGLATPKTYQ